MKALGILTLTFGSGAVSYWIFSLFGGVRMDHSSIAAGVSVGVCFIGFVVGAVIAENGE